MQLTDFEGGLAIELKPGNVVALYMDDGPGGPCGQSMSITRPHSAILVFENFDDFKEKSAEVPIGRNKKARVRWCVIGEHGDHIDFTDHR